MRVFTTAPLTELARAGELLADLEQVGFDGAFSYETDHDPFLPLALAATTTSDLRLGTSIAIAFARTPMLLANLGGTRAVGRGRHHDDAVARCEALRQRVPTSRYSSSSPSWNTTG